MRQITFDTFEEAVAAVKDWSINVTITSEADGKFMFFGHGEKVARWMCGDRVRGRSRLAQEAWH